MTVLPVLKREEFYKALESNDPLDLMNFVCRWEDPPTSDPRWTERIAALCEIVVDIKKQGEQYATALRDLHDSVTGTQIPKEMLDRDIAKAGDLLK